MRKPAEQALRSSIVWAGAWKDVAKRPRGARVCAELDKVKAHTAEAQGEPPAMRLARLANSWADEEAKAGARLQPLPTDLFRRLQQRTWNDAVVACRVLAEATLLWPPARGMVSQMRRPTTRAGRKAQQQRRQAAAQTRAEDRRRRQAATLNSHQWVQVGQSVARCSRCLAIRGAPAAKSAQCPRHPELLQEWRHAATEQGHQVRSGILHDVSCLANTTAALVCVGCGSWTTAAAQSQRCALLGRCRCRDGLAPTRAGREVLARVRRGQHPKLGMLPPQLSFEP